MFGVVERGFGRGSKELGIPTGESQSRSSWRCSNADGADLGIFTSLIPFHSVSKLFWIIYHVDIFLELPSTLFLHQTSTANLPRSSIAPLEQLSSTGIYFGFARLHPIPSSSSSSSTINQAPNPDSNSNSTAEAIPKNGNSSDGSKGLSVQAIESLPGKTAAYPRSQVEGQENDRPSTISSDKTGASAAAAAVNGSGNGNGNDEGEQPALGEEDYKVWPMVMSVGYNPYYGNKEMTAVSLHIGSSQASHLLAETTSSCSSFVPFFGIP
jgi:riboflavin kinase